MRALRNTLAGTRDFDIDMEHLSDYNLEDVCDLGNLLKYSSNGFYISDNTKYIDDTMSEVMTYNCMDEYSRQLFVL